MTTWAKATLIGGVLLLLIGLFWSLSPLSHCQELPPDLKWDCWAGIRWERLLPFIGGGLVAITASIAGVHDKRSLWLHLSFRGSL
jgi:hypothetical protein